MSERQEKKYDVAISFVNADQGLAQELRDKLTLQLEVFLYTHRQQEISGRNGLATFRQVFRTDARLVVVLFQSRWGETPWTRVEHEAIKERYLNEGPDFLFFMVVEKSSPLPPWLPDTHIRFDLTQFSVDEAVGAIKLRVAELGGQLRTETVGERARRTEELSRFREETKKLWQSSEGVRQVREEVDTLTKAMVELAEEASAAAPGLQLESARSDRGEVIGIRGKGASLEARLNGLYVNSLDKAYLRVLFFPHEIVLPGESKMLIGEERIAEDRRYLPARTRVFGWCWEGGDGKHLSSADLADRLIRDLLDMLESRE